MEDGRDRLKELVDDTDEDPQVGRHGWGQDIGMIYGCDIVWRGYMRSSSRI